MSVVLHTKEPYSQKKPSPGYLYGEEESDNKRLKGARHKGVSLLVLFYQNQNGRVQRDKRGTLVSRSYGQDLDSNCLPKTGSPLGVAKCF